MGLWKLDDSIVAVDPVDKLVAQTGTGKTDASLNINSHNAIENAAVTAEINQINDSLTEQQTLVSAETKIGTFNGEDLYRKIITAANVTINNVQVIDATLTRSYVKNVLSMAGTCDTSGQTILPLAWNLSTSNRAYVTIENNGLTLSASSNQTVTSYTCVVIYTKN